MLKIVSSEITVRVGGLSSEPLTATLLDADIDEAQARLDMNRALEIEGRQNVIYTLQHLQTLVGQPIDRLSTLNVAQLVLVNPQPDSLQDWVERAELNWIDPGTPSDSMRLAVFTVSPQRS